MRLNIDRVALVEPLPTAGVALATPLAPGTVLESSPRLLIATSDAALEILELQPSGKRAMPAADFLRGNRVSVGDRFGT